MSHFVLVRKSSTQEGGSSSQNCDSGGSTSGKRARSSEIENTEDSEGLDSKIIHNLQPILMTVYVDHLTEQEMVCVVATIPGGATNAEFSLIGSGPGTSTALITYNWPRMSYEIESMFKKKIASGALGTWHPKILALKKELQQYRASIDSIPQGSIELTLPIPVQTSADSITRSGGRSSDGTTIVIVDLMAYQNCYTVKQGDKKVPFDDF